MTILLFATVLGLKNDIFIEFVFSNDIFIKFDFITIKFEIIFIEFNTKTLIILQQI